MVIPSGHGALSPQQSNRALVISSSPNCTSRTSLAALVREGNDNPSTFEKALNIRYIEKIFFFIFLWVGGMCDLMSRVRAVKLITGKKLDHLQFTLRGVALFQTLHMQDALCIGLPFMGWRHGFICNQHTN